MTKYEYSWRTVPRDPEHNKLWRQRTLELANRGNADARKFRKLLLQRCREDFWFWATGFALVHEPRILDQDMDLRQGLSTAVPFLPWPHQIPVIDALIERLGKKSTRIVKSRAQGATWIVVLITLWCWLFHRGSKINLVSKDEDTVDRKGDMDSVMAKIDWLIAKLPVWMVGKKGKDWSRQYNNHTLLKSDGETGIAGFACTGDVASGGRSLMFVLDEHAKHPRGPDKDALASTQFITKCRVFVSTPKGRTGAFAEIIHDDTIDEPVLHLSWRDNPTQNRGLYTIVDGWPVPVDVEKYGPLPPKYQDAEHWTKLKERLSERGYDLTAKAPRSPWYDNECLAEGADPVLIAQELDEQFGVESARFFADALVNRLLNRAVRPVRGELNVNSETLTASWSENPDGRCRLWTELDIESRPPMGEYIVGCDISAGLGGTGGSNSSITVFDRRRGRKVFGFISPAVKPYEFAELAISICKMFCNYRGDPGFLIWEAQGPGAEFTQRVERSGFQHYYRRKTSDDAGLHSRHSNKPGYWMRKRSKILGPYREALLEGSYDNPDRIGIEELTQYQMGQDGEPYHVSSKDKTSPGGAGLAHGDVVISDGLAWHAALVFGDQHKGQYYRRIPTVMNVRKGDVAPNSFAWRRAEYLSSLTKKKQQPSW